MSSFRNRSRSFGAVVTATDRTVRHRVVEFGELTHGELERWLELRTSNPALDSPYFHPRFAAAVAGTRPGVRIVVGDDPSGVPASFLAMQLDRRKCHPAGYPGADFQGPICGPEDHFDIVAALRSVGASSYEFDHLREGTKGFEPWVHDHQQSPYLDVSGGIEGYLSRASRSGKDKVAEARRLTRKAERNYGCVKIVAESSDSELLDGVIAMKRRQYSLTGSRDYFADTRHIGLVHRLLADRDREFAGMLSAVYAGPHLLAAHFGLRAGPVLHWWFPVYDPDFGRLSPGWLLLIAVIDAAPELGIERIDLGRGLDDYKRRAMTGHQTVCQGAVIPNAWRRRANEAERRTVVAIRSSRIAPAVRSAVRYARRRSG